MTDIEYNVQPRYNRITNRMQYNGNYNNIDIKNMPTFSHMSNVIMNRKNIIKFGRTDAVGVVGFGEKEFTYKFDNFRHCFYDENDEVYKHCRFEKGLDACRSHCESELNNSDAVFRDFKATITNTVVGVKPKINVKPNNEKIEEDIGELVEEPEPEPIGVDSLFRNDVDW